VTELIALTKEIGYGMLVLCAVICTYVGLVVNLIRRIDSDLREAEALDEAQSSGNHGAREGIDG
jgi:hypothetical protein